MDRQKRLIDHIRLIMGEQVEGGGLQEIIEKHNLQKILRDLEYITNSSIADLWRQKKVVDLDGLVAAVDDILTELDREGYKHSDIAHLIAQLLDYLDSLVAIINNSSISGLIFAGEDVLNTVYAIQSALETPTHEYGQDRI